MVLNTTAQANVPSPDIIKISLYSLLLVWSLLANILVIVVVYRNQNLRTNLNYMIVNMAVSDLLIPMFAIPREIAYETSFKWLVDGPVGNALCKLVPTLSQMSPIVSSLSLVIIASQRFIAVVYPTRRHIFSCKARWVFIALPWFVSMALFTPSLICYRVSKYNYCVFVWSSIASDPMSYVTYLSMTILLGFFIPLTSIVVMYSIINHKLKKNIKEVKEMLGREAILSRQRTNRSIFCMLLTIVINFVISWCPYTGIMLWVSASYIDDTASIWLSIDQGTFSKIEFGIFYLNYLQTAVNPCIYFLFLRDFRQGLKELCCRTPVQQNKKNSYCCVCCGGRGSRTLQREQPAPNMHSTSVYRMNTNTRPTTTPAVDSNQHPTCTPLQSIG